MGKLVFKELKLSKSNTVLPSNNGTEVVQKFFRDWQTGELLNSVKIVTKYTIFIICTYNYCTKNILTHATFFKQDYIVDLLMHEIRKHHLAEGILISGFPRNVEQVHRFEKKVRHCLLMM